MVSKPNFHYCSIIMIDGERKEMNKYQIIKPRTGESKQVGRWNLAIWRRDRKIFEQSPCPTVKGENG